MANINEKIENILSKEVLITDSYYGYLINAETISKINKMGYGLRLQKSGIEYFKSAYNN